MKGFFKRFLCRLSGQKSQAICLSRPFGIAKNGRKAMGKNDSNLRSEYPIFIFRPKIFSAGFSGPAKA
jgi:hypothetical protein